MSILVNENDSCRRSGHHRPGGTFHAGQMIAYGTQGRRPASPPARARTLHNEVPVSILSRRPCSTTHADASAIFVPPPFAADAILEAIDAGVPLVVCITEGVPTLDMVRVAAALRGSETRLIGPNCPGVISPGKCKIGIMPGQIHQPGKRRRSQPQRHAHL